MKRRHATRKAVAWKATAPTIASPINRNYYDRKRHQTDTEWKDEYGPKAKAARTDTDYTTGAGGAAEDVNAEDMDKANDAIMERWYGMRGNKTEISIDLSLLHAVSPASR
jgi:hypothetical protein